LFEAEGKLLIKFQNLLVCIPGLFFSPILRQQAQQNFRNLEFRREILEFSRKLLSLAENP